MIISKITNVVFSEITGYFSQDNKTLFFRDNDIYNSRLNVSLLFFVEISITRDMEDD